MIVCRHCGWENPAEAAFCTNCGRGLGRARSTLSSSDGMRAVPSRRFRALDAADPEADAEIAATEEELPVPRLRPPDEAPGAGEAQATLIDFSLPAVLASLRSAAGTATSDGDGDDAAAPPDDAGEAPAVPHPVPGAASSPSGVVDLRHVARALRAEAAREPEETTAALGDEPDAPPADGDEPADDAEDAVAATTDPSPPATPEQPLLRPPPTTATPSPFAAPDDELEDPSDDRLADEGGDFDALDISPDSLDEPPPDLPPDTDTYESVDLEPASAVDDGLEPADDDTEGPGGGPPVQVEEADFEAEEISASELDAVDDGGEPPAAAELDLLESGEYEALDTPPRPIPPPLPEIEARFLLRPLSHNVAATRLIPVGDAPVVIGRGDADVQVPDDPFLSPVHAVFSADDAGLHVEDLGSLNGVWLRVRGEAVLRAGDLFMVGRQLLRIERCTAPGRPEADADGTRRLGAARDADGVRLVQLAADGAERNVYHVSAEGCRIGRHVADVVFTDDTFMSGTHALVLPRGDVFVLRDLSSRNGTWIRIEGRRALAVGDAVMMGQTVWRVGLPVG